MEAIGESVAILFISTKTNKIAIGDKARLSKYQQTLSEYSPAFSFFVVELWVSMLYNDLWA